MKHLFKGVLLQQREGQSLILETSDKTYSVNLVRRSPESIFGLVGKDVLVKGSIRKDGKTIVISKLGPLDAPLDNSYYESVEQGYDQQEFDLTGRIEKIGIVGTDDLEIAS